MFERASVNADPYRRHFLLFAPRDSFAVMIVALDTQSFLTTHFSNYVAVVSNDMVLQAALIAAATKHAPIQSLPTWYCSPFAQVNA